MPGLRTTLNRGGDLDCDRGFEVQAMEQGRVRGGT
jgi:hypothetical protein